ncbi:MAG: YicC family protein [Vallitaleaceae bacterium]|nr:YicC family protein [Vallitaleaceae bacterium]
MINSMTGFGRGEFTQKNRSVTVEMKSVNHRYCEINIRMPRNFVFLENDLKNKIKNELQRGKIDVFINYEDRNVNTANLKYNEELAAQYLNYVKQISERFSLSMNLDAFHLSRYPEVLSIEAGEEDEEFISELIQTALDEALKDLQAARFKEGQLLKADLSDKLDELLSYVENLKVFTPMVIDDYRQKLTLRVSELLGQPVVDEQRIALEVAVFADKSCIDEEIVRLESHVKHMKDILDTKEAVGRKLDFIAQEMNREANTVLSKANNLGIANQGIDLKTVIEKIREQIQNIE